MNNETKKPETQNSDLNALSEEFVKLLISAGVCPDKNIKDKTAQQREQEKNKKYFRCTKVLMENYRNIVTAINFLSLPELKILPELQNKCEIIDTVLDYVDTEYLFRQKVIEEKLNSLKFSRLLVERVNLALTVLSCGSSKNKLYKVLYYKYIDADELPEAEILNKLEIGRTQYYDKLREGLDELSKLLWITNDIEISLVFDAISKLNIE